MLKRLANPQSFRTNAAGPDTSPLPVEAAEHGAVRSVVEALDATKDAASTGQCIVQEQAVLFLVDISRLATETIDEMKHIDAADWIENALAKLPESNYPELHF